MVFYQRNVRCGRTCLSRYSINFIVGVRRQRINATMRKLSKSIGKNIVKIRRGKHITSERLAYENDISKGYMSDIENGKRLPSLPMLARIARALGVSLSRIFDGL